MAESLDSKETKKLKKLEQNLKGKFLRDYDFSQAVWKGYTQKLKIICSKHGEFYQSPQDLKCYSRGCKKCAGEKRALQNLTEYLRKAKEIHKNRYDYSKIVEFERLDKKVPIVCPEHGIFWQTLDSHLRGVGCPKCGFKKQGTQKETLERRSKQTQERWKKVIESKGPYKVLKTTALSYRRGFFEIECLKHKTRLRIQIHQIAEKKRKHFCSKCALESNRQAKNLSFEEFKERIQKKLKSSNSYCLDFLEEYSNYKNCNSKIQLKCKIHGNYIKNFCGNLVCPQCAKKNFTEKRRKSTTQFIKDAQKIHGDVYDYSKVVYTGAHCKVLIRCKKHGFFEQFATTHLAGLGCSLCSGSNLETKVYRFLQEKNIVFETQKTFEKCQDKKVLRFDFYLPAFETVLECQGIQHYTPVDYFGGLPAFLSLQKRDQIKREFCKKEGIRLIEIPYTFATYQEIKTFLQKEVL